MTRRAFPLRRLVAGLGVAVAAVLGQVALQTGALGQGPATPAPEDLTSGRTLYQSSCASCHGQQGEGSQRGPSLEGVGAASVDFQVSTGRMPLREEQPTARRGPVQFDRDQVRALVDYVGSLSAGGPPVPDVHPGSLTDGRRLYLLNCAACHSATGVGAAQVGGRAAPSLYEATPTQIAEAVRVGPGLMPQYPENALSDDEVDAVVSYIGSLHRTNDRGGQPLGLVGPVAETVVGWVLGVGLLVLLVRQLGARRR